VTKMLIDDDERERMARDLVSSEFAWSMLKGRSPELLAIVLTDQLERHLRGAHDDIDVAVRREHLFRGIDVLGAAGLPIAITWRMGSA